MEINDKDSSGGFPAPSSLNEKLEKLDQVNVGGKDFLFDVL